MKTHNAHGGVSQIRSGAEPGKDAPRSALPGPSAPGLERGYALGPIDVRDPVWWQRLFLRLAAGPRGELAMTGEERASWSRWLQLPTTGPQGEALSWETFAVGVEWWCGQQLTEELRRGFRQWMAWHGSGRRRPTQAVEWGPDAPAPWAVWRTAAAQEGGAAAITARIRGWLKPSTSLVGESGDITEFLRNIPLEHLDGLSTHWPALVRLLVAGLDQTPTTPAAAWQSEETLVAHGATGIWQQWLAPWSVGAVGSDGGRVDFERYRLLQHCLGSLGERGDWPEEALAIWWEARGFEMFQGLTAQQQCPERLVRMAWEQATRELRAAPTAKPPVNACHGIATALRLVWQTIPPEGTVSMHPERSAFLEGRYSSADLVAGLVDFVLEEEELARAAVTQTPPHQLGLYQTNCWKVMALVAQRADVGRIFRKESLRRLLAHPTPVARETGLFVMGRIAAASSGVCDAPSPAAKH